MSKRQVNTKLLRSLTRKLAPEDKATLASELVRQKGVKVETASAAQLEAAAASAAGFTSESDARARVLRALPWVLGGIALVAVLVFASRKRTRGNPRRQRRRSRRMYLSRYSRRRS